MKDSELRTKAKAFALHIIAVCDEVDTRKGRGVLVNQIVRSATSIGANIHEANYAASKADFINKFQIALKECYETDYWLGLFKDTHMITKKNTRICLLNVAKSANCSSPPSPPQRKACHEKTHICLS